MNIMHVKGESVIRIVAEREDKMAADKAAVQFDSIIII
jgi:hypothetical protein